jgi:putative flippase GtrA
MTARLLGRHQAAAAAATAVDFAVMIALVEVAGAPPPLATVLSAITGALANFTLSRVWAFRGRHSGGVFSQARRYAAVAIGGALLNALLLAIAIRLVAFPYVILRGAVAIAVSVFYTYPLHTRVVFRVAPASAP